MHDCHPWHSLDSLPGVTVVVEPIEDCWGYYDADTNTIHIDSRLTQAERRSTLIHELVHARHGDRPCLTDWHDRKRERAVDLEAARLLIPLDALADALAWAENEWEVADALWVDVDTVRTRLGRLTRAEKAAIEARQNQPHRQTA